MNADRLSGLPFLKDILAVKIDGDLAPDYIAGQEERRAAGRALPVRAEAKLAYLRRLRAAALKPLNRLEVKLRRVDRERGSAFFEVVYDVYAISPAGFTRYTLQLEQKDSAWRSAFLARSGDYSEPTAASGRAWKIRAGRERADVPYHGGIEGLRVEEVCRARIGPSGTPPPVSLPAGRRRCSDQALLHFPLTGLRWN